MNDPSATNGSEHMRLMNALRSLGVGETVALGDGVSGHLHINPSGGRTLIFAEDSDMPAIIKKGKQKDDDDDDDVARSVEKKAGEGSVASQSEDIATWIGKRQEQGKDVCGGCGAKEKEGGVGGGALLQCAKCRNQRYCSKACQKLHWKAHKRVCKSS